MNEDNVLDPSLEPAVGGPYEHAFAVPAGEVNLDELVGEEHGPLIQRGRMIHCLTEGHTHGTALPRGKMLTKKNGKYVLVDEIVLTRTGRISKKRRLPEQPRL